MPFLKYLVSYFLDRTTVIRYNVTLSLTWGCAMSLSSNLTVENCSTDALNHNSSWYKNSQSWQRDFFLTQILVCLKFLWFWNPRIVAVKLSFTAEDADMFSIPASATCKIVRGLINLVMSSKAEKPFQYSSDRYKLLLNSLVNGDIFKEKKDITIH